MTGRARISVAAVRDLPVFADGRAVLPLAVRDLPVFADGRAVSEEQESRREVRGRLQREAEAEGEIAAEAPVSAE